MTALVHVREISYTYPEGTRSLDAVSFSIAPGEKVAIIGPNGAGKTTLLHLLTGLLTPQSGSIEIDGQIITPKQQKDMWKNCGLVFQHPDDQLFHATVYDDVVFGPRNLGFSDEVIERESYEILHRVGLWEKRQKAPWQLSYGERRRAALATVLVMHPRILLLDEPTTYLDPHSYETVIDILASLQRTIILVTQDLLFAARLCRRAIYLENGRVKALDTIAHLVAREDMLVSEKQMWRNSYHALKSLGWSHEHPEMVNREKEKVYE